MKIFKCLAFTSMVIAVSGCMTNAADNAIPAPTNLKGIYKASIMGGSVSWEIFADGTGVSCEQRNSVGTEPQLRDIVINGNKAYDFFEFTLTNVSEKGFIAEGVADMNFKKLKKWPVACKY